MEWPAASCAGREPKGRNDMETEQKKRDPRNILIVVLIVVAVVAVALAVWALSTRVTPEAAAPRLTPKPTPTEEPLTNTIALPQFAWLNLKADTTEQTLTFDNPKHIPADCTINASLTHTGNFTLKTDKSKKIPFTLNAFDEDVAAGTPVIVSQYWSNTRNNNCYAEFNIVISRDSWKSAEAGGNYTTPVTYTSELVDHIVDPADGGTDRG